MARNLVRAGVGLGAILGGGVLLTTPSYAAQNTEQLNCDGVQVTIRTNDNHSSENGGWSIGRIVDGGSGFLIPTSFSGSVYDVTQDTQLFSFEAAKGSGNANQNQTAITCTQTETGPLSEFLEPGEQPPPGTQPTDTITVTFTVTAVPKP